MRIVAVLALSALLLAACGGEDSDTSPSQTPAAPDTAPARPIVFEARGSDPADPNSTDIFSMDPATGETMQLTRDGSSKQPAWSPDYTQIVFASDVGEPDAQEEIYIMRADGTGVRRLTTTPGVSEWHPRISPDGARIAYMSVESDASFVKVMNIDGTGAEAVSDGFRLLRSGVWSPDGKEIFFSGLGQDQTQFDIFSINVETRALRARIATHFSEACPHVTSDGRTLIYGNVAGDGRDTNIDLFAHDLSSDDTSGASDERLTTDPSVDDYGDPDTAGRSLVFVSRRDGNPELYVLDRDTHTERRLTTTLDLDEDNPDW
jgi:TolB protein